MPDLLVILLKLPPLHPLVEEQQRAGVAVRRAQAGEATPLRLFMLENFEPGWADEIAVG